MPQGKTRRAGWPCCRPRSSCRAYWLFVCAASDCREIAPSRVTPGGASLFFRRPRGKDRGITNAATKENLGKDVSAAETLTTAQQIERGAPQRQPPAVDTQRPGGPVLSGHVGDVSDDIAQRALATLETVRSACDRLAANLAQSDRLAAGGAFTIGEELGRFGSWCVEVAENLDNSARIPSPWESDAERDAMRKRRGFDDDAKPVDAAGVLNTVQWVRLNVWIKHNGEIRAANCDSASIERAYWELYALLDEHFPEGDTVVCPVSGRQLSEGASDAELFTISVDTGESRFDVDAREVDLRVAFVDSLRGIAERNLAAADAIDQLTDAKGGIA